MPDHHQMNTYLVEIKNEHSDEHRVIGLFQGHYRLMSQLPFHLSEKLCQVRLIPFNHYSEQDELAEFRVLNSKDRVVIRSTETNVTIAFGYEPDLKRFIVMDNNGSLAFHGPILLHQAAVPQPNIYHQDNGEEGGAYQQIKYTGHLTLNIFGCAMIDLGGALKPSTTNDGIVHMYLPGASRFSVERIIPYRFQQKSIVQRQRDKFQNCSSLTSLETFNHLLF